MGSVKLKTPFDLISNKTDQEVDGPLSWLVMMAAFGSMFIVIGYQRSFGLLFVAFNERYGHSSGLLSVVNGTQSFVYSFSTMLVMNVVLKKISIRTSCMLGASIQAAGVMINFLYHDMASLIVCQGVMFGLGHSLLYCPTLLILSQYFERHRSVATAIASCGCSAGGIAFPYITRYLLNNYGLEATLLILGAIIFNQCVFYAFFQPIIRNEGENKILSSGKDVKCNTEYPSDLQSQNPNLNNQKYDHCLKANTDTNFDDLIQATDDDDSKLLHPNGYSISPKVGLSSSQVIYPVVKIIPEGGDNNRLFSSHNCMLPDKSTTITQSLSNKSKEFLAILGGSSVGLHSSLSLITPSMVLPNKDNTTNEDLDKASCNLTVIPTGCRDEEHEVIYGNGNHNSKISTADQSLLNGTSTNHSKNNRDKGCVPVLVKLPKFWTVAVFIIGGIIMAGCPALFIPPLAREKGLSNDDAAFFLMISATTDFLGRIISGLVLHFKLVDCVTLALLPLTLATVFFNLTPILNDFKSLLILTLQYGFSSSMYWTLWTLVIIETLGLANLGPAMGFYAVIFGFTTSASFPLAGWLHDATGSFSSSFHYFGAASLLSAVALLVIIIPRYKHRCLKGLH